MNVTPKLECLDLRIEELCSYYGRFRFETAKSLSDFEYAKKLTQLAIEADVDYIKFQLYSGDTLVSKLEIILGKIGHNYLIFLNKLTDLIKFFTNLFEFSNDNKENLMFENYWRNMIEYNKNKLNNNFKPKEISLGDEIITINSNLCNLSYDHFSKSYSKGVKLFFYFI